MADEKSYRLDALQNSNLIEKGDALLSPAPASDDTSARASQEFTSYPASKPLLSADDDSDDEGDIEDLHMPTTDQQRPFWQKSKVRRIAVIVASIIICGSLFLLFLKQKPMGTISDENRHWQGFSNIEHWFAFGDSWTDSHFMPWEDAPSRENPQGNPPFPGWTSTHDANYVGYLVTKYNQSFIKAYTIALSSSTVNTTIVPAFVDWLDLVHQVKDRWMPFYTTNYNSPGGVSQPLNWTPESAMFSFFFGINDIIAGPRENPRYDEIFDSYERSIATLYAAGARNFLFINVPSVDQAPSITMQGNVTLNEQIRQQVSEFNDRVNILANKVRTHQELYQGSTVFEYDLHTRFEQVIANPGSIEETKSYKNVKDACKEYEKLELGAAPTKEQLEICNGLAVEEYLWFNALHVSWPVHDIFAADIAKILKDGSKQHL